MSTDIVTVEIPMTFRQRGSRKLIVSPDGTSLSPAPQRPRIDNVLLKALARAFRWQTLLDDGTYGTIKELAKKEKVDASYVGDVLRLTLLAPDIVEMILDGRQPKACWFEKLRRGVPWSWQDQRDVMFAKMTP